MAEVEHYPYFTAAGLLKGLEAEGLVGEGAGSVSRQDLLERRHTFQEEGRSGLVYELSTSDGIYFWHIRRSIPAAGKAFVIKKEESFLHFQFNLSGQGSWEISDTEPVSGTFSDNNLGTFYIRPSQEFGINLSSGEQAEISGFSISPAFFMQHIPAEHELSRSLRHFKQQQRSGPLNEYPVNITPAIRMVLYDLLNCPLEKRYKALFLKAKTIELLVLHLSAWEQNQATAPGAGLKSSEIQKMMRAQEIILQDLRNPPGIYQLAQEVGTNENYLKKHFKIVHGSTVFNYITQERMKRAKDLLSSGKKSLSEVAALSGYKHPHHFSTAFRKVFGFSPSRLKALLLGIWNSSEWAVVADAAVFI